MMDLEAPLADLWLPRGRFGPYRSLLVVACVDGDPLGTAVLSVNPAGQVSRDGLADQLRRQLEAELGEVFAQRGLSLPRSLPSMGIPGGAGGGGDTPAPRRSVSVVVTTCCNPAPLERCLRSILACDYDGLEVIVVENRPGSSTTRLMLAERFPTEHRLRYVEEPSPGLSRARNAGLALAEGELVAFTDDDVIVDPAWVRRCAEGFARAPDVACVTGLILPLRLETDSQLLLERFAGFGKGFRRQMHRLDGARDADPLFPYTPGVIGSGANTVLRADVARRLGGFDTSLGAGTPAVGGEDLDLYIRLLREGCAVAYEPSAIVWHEHPDGKARLRRQVCRYGIGLGATLAKQLVAGPERRELVRAVPAGVRYARDPASRKNAGKTSDYPRRLDWLERLGMLTGPVAYLTSRAVAATRRRPRLPPGDSRAAATPAPRQADTAQGREIASRADRTLTAAALAACVTAPLLVALGLPVALRFPAVLALLCLGPGTALLTAVRGRLELGLVLGVSLAVSAVVAQSMLWFDAWRPNEFLYALAGACLLPLGLQLGRLLRAGRAATASRRAGLGGVPRFALAHAALLSMALLLWCVSLAEADLSRLAGIGLLNAMPATYFVAFGLLLVGFAVAVARDQLPRKLLWLYLLALILVLHGTTALLYDEPRYAWTYKHLGVIDFIATRGGVDRELDIYNNWPGFFALNAWLSSVTGLSPIAYAGWAQLFFNLANVAAVRFALRGLTRDERLLWTATWLFVLGNWVGQDYLAPQAFGFLLSVVVLGLCLRCSPAAKGPRLSWDRWRVRSLDRLARAVLPHREPDDPLAPAPLGPRAALVVGGLCFLAVVISHQFSPVLLILSVTALSLLIRRIPLWIPAVMVVIEVWWVALSWPFVQYHFDLLDPGGAGVQAVGRDLSAAPPGAVLSFYAPAAVIALIGLLALIGAVGRLRAGKWDLAPACLIVAPLLGAALQSYGGEGVYRAYLFALPWLAFFAAAACAGPPRRSPAAIRLRRLITATSAVGVCLLFAYFGQELANRITRGEVRAQVWYEQRASAASEVLHVASVVPSHATARYPRLRLARALLLRPAFRGHRLGAADLPRLKRLVERLDKPRVFIMLSRRQGDYAHLNGLLPEGSIASLKRALRASPAFRLVFRRPTAWVFQYVPRTPARPRA